MGAILSSLQKKLETLQERQIGHRFLYLLISLILLIALQPQISENGVGSGILLTLVLVSGIYAMSDDKRQLVISIILAIPVLVIGWAFIVFLISSLETARILFGIAFYAFLTVRILSHVLKTKHVTRETIFGAICVYLLIGITWATAYLFVEALVPGSFLINPDLHDRSSVFLYFSFITLTTTGYGDITPLTAIGRTLAMFETVTGVLFTAVLVARLVGSLGMRGEEETG